MRTKPQVNELLTTNELDQLDAGYTVERVAGEWKVTAVPDVDDIEELARTLFDIKCPSLDWDHISSRSRTLLTGWTEIASYVLDNFERKSEQPEPAYLIDRYGDRWKRVGDDQYTYQNSMGTLTTVDVDRMRSRSFVEERYGPVTESA